MCTLQWWSHVYTLPMAMGSKPQCVTCMHAYVHLNFRLIE